jgi:hypothetical protein
MHQDARKQHPNNLLLSIAKVQSLCLCSSLAAAHQLTLHAMK